MHTVSCTAGYSRSGYGRNIINAIHVEKKIGNIIIVIATLTELHEVTVGSPVHRLLQTSSESNWAPCLLFISKIIILGIQVAIGSFL